MGRWLRRCSSICPSASCGTGTGPGGYWGQGSGGLPSCPRPPGCSRPRCCPSASCAGRRTSRSRSAAAAGLAPWARPSCASPGPWPGPRRCPRGTWPRRSPCWRRPGGAGSRRPPAPPAEEAALSCQPGTGSPPAPGRRAPAPLQRDQAAAGHAATATRPLPGRAARPGGCGQGPEAPPAQPAEPPLPSGAPGPPHLPVAAVGAQPGRAGLHALVPGQRVLLEAVQERVQDPERGTGPLSTRHAKAAPLPCSCSSRQPAGATSCGDPRPT